MLSDSRGLAGRNLQASLTPPSFLILILPWVGGAEAGAGGLALAGGRAIGHQTPLNLGELGFLHKDVLLQRLHQIFLRINQVSHVPCRREVKAS